MGPLCRALITAGLLAPLCRGFAQTTASLDYCRSTVPPGHTLPEIPVGQQGRDEQDPQRDELSLSLAWVTASESFAELARLTEHSALTSDAKRRSHAARDAIRPAYYDPRKQQWASGHLRSGAPVEGLTGSLIALSHHGLLGEQEQSALLDALASPRYRTLWGIRSTPNDSPLYDPDAYARGSVWALGTADAITAFYEAGRAATATALWRDLVPWFGLDSPGHMHEVLNGDAFVPERESVPDQTWSSAAFVSSGVRGLLGLHVDASNRRLTFTPRIPADWDSLRVRHIALAGTELGLALRTSSDRVELEIENPGPAMTLTFRPPLQSGVHVRSADPSDGVRLTSAVTDEIHVICPANRTGRVVLQLAPAR
jgi:hypothetical protein